MLATFDGLLLASATVVAAVATVTVPVWLSNRKTRRQLGAPNGGGSIAGDIAAVKQELKSDIAQAKDDLRRDVNVVSTAATAALAVAEANGVEQKRTSSEVQRTSDEMKKLTKRLDRHLEIHGCPPLGGEG